MSEIWFMVVAHRLTPEQQTTFTGPDTRSLFRGQTKKYFPTISSEQVTR
jgi:hypothetical protein